MGVELECELLDDLVARVHDGTGRVLRNGVVLIQNGRIKAVGEDLAIPYGAEVLDLETGVATRLLGSVGIVAGVVALTALE